MESILSVVFVGVLALLMLRYGTRRITIYEYEGGLKYVNGRCGEAVAELVDQLIRGKWVDQDGKSCPLTAADLRVVAPYNAQVNRLAARLEPLGVPVGTVDKFQGQTCAAVIYSMATSSPEDAPRGMEFLYSLNRLNVATSRGRCASFIVASPALLEPQCRTPRQMQLANGLCRFVEMARGV